MCLLKLVGQIFLFLSIISFTFAGIAQTPTMDAMHVNLVTGAKEVTESTERGYTQSEELPERLGRLSTTGNLHARLDLIVISDAAAEDSESKKFFSKQLNRKLKKYLMLGTLGGVISGITTGVQDEIMGTLSPNAYVFTFLPYPSPLANT
jgi:hypothetical protein